MQRSVRVMGAQTPVPLSKGPTRSLLITQIHNVLRSHNQFPAQTDRRAQARMQLSADALVPAVPRAA